MSGETVAETNKHVCEDKSGRVQLFCQHTHFIYDSIVTRLTSQDQASGLERKGRVRSGNGHCDTNKSLEINVTGL